MTLVRRVPVAVAAALAASAAFDLVERIEIPITAEQAPDRARSVGVDRFGGPG